MAIEIVDFPIKNGGPFRSYVAVYQRGKRFNVTSICAMVKSWMILAMNTHN